MALTAAGSHPPEAEFDEIKGPRGSPSVTSFLSATEWTVVLQLSGKRSSLKRYTPPDSGRCSGGVMDTLSDSVWATPTKDRSQGSPPEASPTKVQRVDSSLGSTLKTSVGGASGETPVATTAITSRTAAARGGSTRTPWTRTSPCACCSTTPPVHLQCRAPIKRRSR